MGWYAGVPYGENIRLLALQFSYEDAPCEVFPFGGGALTFETWRRDVAGERACFARLEALGLSRCGSALSHALKPALRDVMLFHPIDSARWEDLLMVQLPELAGMVGSWTRIPASTWKSCIPNISTKTSRKRPQREDFRLMPPDRILIETDAPALSPPSEHNLHPLTDPATGEPLNHPANLKVALHALAETLGCDTAAAAALTTANWIRLFVGTSA